MIAARQIFAVAVDCVNVMSELMKDKLKPEVETKEFKEKMENYKVQLGKYHGMLLADLKNGAGQDKTTAYLDALVAEHKNSLLKLKEEKGGYALHVDKVIDICLSLRVNALQQAPEMRHAYVQALVRGNALVLNQTADILKDLFFVPSHPLKHALCSLLSLFASTAQGVRYLTKGFEDFTALEKLMDVLKDQDDGSVTQRFCLAALQKVSFLGSQRKNDRLMNGLVNGTKGGAIEWIAKYMDRSRMRTKEVNEFCQEFASALLANLLSSAPG